MSEPGWVEQLEQVVKVADDKWKLTEYAPPPWSGVVAQARAAARVVDLAWMFYGQYDGPNETLRELQAALSDYRSTIPTGEAR